MEGSASPSRRRFNPIALGIASLVLLVFVGLSYRQWELYRSANAEAERSRQILDALDSVQALLVDSETGQRGFLLTGEDRYLDTYNRAIQELPNQLAALKQLLGSGQRGMQDFNELNALANKKEAELRQTIETRRSQGAQAALAIVLTDQGKRTMDSIRALCAQMRGNENSIQAHSSADGEAAAGFGLLITVAGSLVLLFLFAFGFEPFASPDPQAWRRSRLLRYGAAILAVVAITLIRAALSPLMGPNAMPFTLYFCAVAFAAWFGGFRPAALSIVLSLLAGSWFFAAPPHSLWVSGHDDQVAMLMIVLVGFGIALLGRSQRTAVERAVRAENSERSERQRFETTLTSIGDAVIATDARGKVVFLNPEAERLTGSKLTEVEGKEMTEVFAIFNEKTGEPVDDPVGKVMEHGLVVGLANHTALRGAGGELIPIEDSAAPIRDDLGQLTGVVLVFRDVTEERRTQRESRLLASIVASSEDAILTKDLKGIVTSWNHGAQHMFGYTAGEMVGQPALKLYPPGRENELREILDRVRRGEQMEHFRTVRRRKDGTLLDISLSVSPLVDADGEVVGASKIMRDVTAEVNAQKEVVAQRERLRVTLRSIGDAVITTDAEGRVSYLNPVAEQLTGWGSHEAMGRPLAEVMRIVNENTRLEVENPVQKVLREGVVVGLANHTLLIARDGKELPIDDSAAPIRDDRGEVTGVVLVFRDATVDRKQQETLRRTEKLSAAARLSATMAHEINNPLAAVVNLIFIARSTPAMPPRALEYLTQAEQELERVTHITRQTLGFYRESTTMEGLDIPGLVESVLTFYSPKLEAKSITVRRAFTACPAVIGVAGELRQAVSNLVANAIDAVEPEGSINVSVHPVTKGGEGFVEVAVADQGQGIAAEHIGHLFEPFFTTKKDVGTGLGLWSAKNIVERHGGTISVSSGKGEAARGATFTIHLPFVASPEPSATEPLTT